MDGKESGGLIKSIDDKQMVLNDPAAKQDFVWTRVAAGEAGALIVEFFRSRRRWIDEPMPIASRYLATVRRAMSIPASRNLSTIVSSDSTSAAGSASR